MEDLSRYKKFAKSDSISREIERNRNVWLYTRVSSSAQKDNYSLAIKKGIVSVDGNELKEDAAAKYKILVDALGGADIELKNSQK